MSDPLRIPGLKGPTPRFFAAAGVDELLHMVIAMAAELSAVTDELDSVKRVLAERGAVPPAALAAYAPDPQAQAERAARREEFLRALLAPLELEVAELANAVATARGVRS